MNPAPPGPRGDARDLRDPRADGRSEAAAETREALIAAALVLFGERGFAAASTREIAGRAKANIAAIAYHFGGKEGLRAACADAIAGRIGGVVDLVRLSEAGTRSEARAALDRLVAAITRFLASPPAEPIAAFMLREMAEEGPALDRLYAGLIEPRHRELCRLWGLATGRPAEAEETRLAAFAMLGQVLYFRIGRPVVLRRMGWAGYGPAEADRVAALLRRNLAALIDATERDTAWPD